MDYLFQYADYNGEIVTKIAKGQEIIEMYGCSDFNETSNHHVYLPTKEFGLFEECKIIHSHNEVVDKFEHLDIYCSIINSKGKVLETFSYQEH